MKKVNINISSAGFPSQFVSDSEKETVEFGLQIGQAINRDHSTVLYARTTLFDELMTIKSFVNIYNQYKMDILGQKIDEK